MDDPVCVIMNRPGREDDAMESYRITSVTEVEDAKSNEIKVWIEYEEEGKN